MENKMIVWKKLEKDQGGTPLERVDWLACDTDGQELGWLQYENVGKNKEWCWHQMAGIRMAPEDLQEVRDKQKALLNAILNAMKRRESSG